MAEISEKLGPVSSIDNRSSDMEREAGVLSSSAQIIDIKNADKALDFLRSDGLDDLDLNGLLTGVDEKKLVRKIDWLIMPLMFLCYFLQYLDKTLINYANVMGLEKDTGTTAGQFSNLALVFYITYFVFEIPQGWGMQRFPTGKWIGGNVILWGICVTTNSACHSFTSLVAVRVLLGIFESAVAPSLILITAMWYKKHEQPMRIGIWYLGTGMGVITGAIASYGFQHYVGHSFTSWQIMFLVFGVITIAVGICVVIFLPDNPMDAKFFTREEKLFAIERLRSNKTGIENKIFKLSQALECIKDIHTWFFVIIMTSANVSNGAISSFQATIIKSFGFTSEQTALLSIPSGVVSIISILSSCLVAGKTNTRALNIVGLTLPAILGAGLMAFLPDNEKVGKLIGTYMINSLGAVLPLIYAWVAANYAGHTKKVTMNAILLMAFCVGNIIGPLTFTGSTAPVYTPAKIAIIATGAICVVFTLALMFVYMRENKRRDRLGLGSEHLKDREFMDLTDKENPEFRYSL